MPRKARPKIRGIREPEELPSGKWRGWTWDASRGRKGPSKTWPSYDEARSWMAVEQARLDGVLTDDDAATAAVSVGRVAARRPLLRDYLVETVELAGGNASVRRNRGSVARILGRRWPDKRINELTAVDVQVWMADEEAAGYAWNTRHGRLCVLRKAMRRAKKEGLRLDDPTEHVTLGKRRAKRELRTPTDAEVERIMSFLPEGLRPAVLLGRDQGLRMGEVVALRWRHLDLTGARHDGVPAVYVGPIVLQADNSEQPFPKGGEGLWVPLSPRAVAALNALKTRQHGQPNDRVFRDVYNPAEPITIRRFDYQWLSARDLARLPEPLPRFHDLRHGLGYDLRLAPPMVIKRLMRHKHLSTSEVYIDDLPLAEAVTWMPDNTPPPRAALTVVPPPEAESA